MVFLCLLFLELLALLSARYPCLPARFSSPDVVSHVDVHIHTCST